MSDFRNWIQVKEVCEDVANRLLKLGWKIISTKEVPTFTTESGWFHSKTHQSGRKTLYIMGCPANIEPMKNESKHYYLHKMEKKTDE